MSERTAKADLTPVRQRTQYTCMSTSLMMCLQALGYDVDEDEVNKVMGARPMKGAAWEQALAAAQHYGARATLVTPSTVGQLKEWTDAGKPVMIAWNPEDREWSHASVVFDVDDDLNVHVADPNIPDPDETVRVMPKGDFYGKWYEKWPNYLVRRPAMMLDREITPEGRQVMAKSVAGKGRGRGRGRGKKRPQEVRMPKTQKERLRIKREPAKPRNPHSRALRENKVNINPGGHVNKPLRGKGTRGKGKQQRHLQHKGQDPTRQYASAARVATVYLFQKRADMDNGRLDRSLRTQINRALVRAKLDGNGRFRKPSTGYSRAVFVAHDFGVELDEVVSSHLFNAPKGVINVNMAFTNPEDRFSPIPITNSVLHIQFTELRADVYEVVAYMS